MFDLSDAELLQRYRRRRDDEAFDVLVDRHGPDVVRLAACLLGDPHAAQDVAQEAFLRLAEQRRSLAPRGDDGSWSLAPWLTRVVRNLCLDRLRQRGRRGECALLEELCLAPAPQSGHPVERADLVWRAVGDLTALQRAAVILRYRDGLAYRAIADQLGKSVDHVGVLLHEALARLRRSEVLRQEVLS